MLTISVAPLYVECNDHNYENVYKGNMPFYIARVHALGIVATHAINVDIPSLISGYRSPVRSDLASPCGLGVGSTNFNMTVASLARAVSCIPTAMDTDRYSSRIPDP